MDKPQNNGLDSEYVRKTYNDFLSDYDQEYGYYRWFRTPVSRFHFSQSRRAFLKALGAKRYLQALEVGGGDGVWTKMLLPNVDHLDFLDISEEMISRAQKRLQTENEKISFIRADFMDNRLSQKKYDFALSFRNLEYFPDKAKGVSEFARLLKPGGELIIVTKSPEYDWKKYFAKKKLHSGQISMIELRNLLERNDFKVVMALPAILGKKIGWAPLRWFFHALQHLLIRLPQALIPDMLIRYMAESYLLKAKKN